MSVRLGFPRGARLVVVLSRGDGSAEARWRSIHLTQPAWDRIFAQGLQLLDLPAILQGQSLDFGEGLGQLNWTGNRYWTTIGLRFLRGSARKREVMTTALLKTARYHVV
jgi:hypothetical protein